MKKAKTSQALATIDEENSEKEQSLQEVEGTFWKDLNLNNYGK